MSGICSRNLAISLLLSGHLPRKYFAVNFRAGLGGSAASSLDSDANFALDHSFVRYLNRLCRQWSSIVVCGGPASHFTAFDLRCEFKAISRVNQVRPLFQFHLLHRWAQIDRLGFFTSRYWGLRWNCYRRTSFGLGRLRKAWRRVRQQYRGSHRCDKAELYSRID
jgi:hypothetical protein